MEMAGKLKVAPHMKLDGLLFVFHFGHTFLASWSNLTLLNLAIMFDMAKVANGIMNVELSEMKSGPLRALLLPFRRS